MSNELYRIVNIELEAAILRSMLSSCDDNNVLQTVIDNGICAEWFYDPFNKQIAKELIDKYSLNCAHPDMLAMSQTHGSNKLTPILAVKNDVNQLSPRISKLAKTYQRRETTHMLEQALHMAKRAEIDTDTILSALSEKTDLLIADSSEAEYYTAKQGIAAVKARMAENSKTKGMNGLSTSYPEIDDMLRGLQPGRIYIIAAQSGKGKSVFTMNLVSQQIYDEKRVAVFSLEMSFREVWERIVIHNARFSANVIAGKAKLTPLEANRLTTLARKINDDKVDIVTYDRGGMSIEQIIAAIHRQHREKPLDLVAIDYIQLIHSQKQHTSREQELAYISRTLKGLARQLEIPIVFPAQINDAGLVRESRSLKFDSDAYIEIQDKYIEIDKNRAGPTGKVDLEMDGEHQRFNVIK